MRLALLATAILSVAATSAAQSHEPAAAAPAAAPAETGHAAASAPAHAETSASPKPGTTKVPVVSRITAPPKPSAAAEGATAAGEAKRPKVLVSGATPAMAAKVEAGGHAAGLAAEHGAGAKPRVSGSIVSPAAKPSSVEVAAATAPVAPSATPPRTVNPRAPVKLETVHGRLAAALAGFRAESKGANPHSESDEPGAASPAGSRAHRDPVPSGPRFLITWPEVRWRVNWPDDLTRVAVSWPE